MDAWLIILIVAVVGALAYFIIGDWFNSYIVAANPFGGTVAKGGGKA